MGIAQGIENIGFHEERYGHEPVLSAATMAHPRRSETW
jgi:hypothetical protein